MSQRIMAVDDSDISQEFIKMNLAQLGYEDVVGFMNPLEALAALEQGTAQPDLILLDIMMPEMDGIELCARIRVLEAWRDTPIIMLTSRVDMESLSQAFMAGANDYVTKPFNRIELQARMRSSLRLKAELDRRRANDRRAPRGATVAAGELASDAQQIVSGKSGMLANFMSMHPKTQARVSVAAFKIDNIRVENDLDAQQDAQIVQRVAKVLADVTIPAGDSFAHMGDDLFCLASVDVSAHAFEQRVKAFMAAVAAAKMTLSDTWSKPPLTLSAAFVSANGAAIAGNLAQAISAVEAASAKQSSSFVPVFTAAPMAL
jgi:CheY-like chemotaxis protein